MNIAVLHYHRIGGSGVVAYEIGKAMSDKKHDVHFIGLSAPFRLLESESRHLHFHKIWIKEYPVFDFQPYTLALASQLADIIDRYDIDVVHSHYALPHAIAAILARDIAKKKIKCVTTLHGTDITVVGSHPTMKNISRHAINSSDAVTAVSNFLKTESEKILDIKPGFIQTVYNFVNPKEFHPNLGCSKLFNAQENRKVIIHVSNLREVKNPIDVLTIFHGILHANAGNFELWIVGEGPMEVEMREWSIKHGVENRVKFMGVRSNIGRLLSACELMILPSKTESFGLSALEAMACGVPVLASRAGGLPEVIEDEVSGLLFEPGNTQEAIRKAVSLITNKKKLANMKKASIQHAHTNFQSINIINQYENLYLSLCTT